MPLAQERYYLACLKSVLDEPGLHRLRELLAAPAWQQQVESLPGYAPDASGQVLSLRRQLPWWQLEPREKTRAKQERKTTGRTSAQTIGPD